MPVPRVTIVGRPNVGKSSLLNWLAKKRIAIVDSTAGVTRDRIMYLMHESDRYFELIDTGGMGIDDVDNLSEEIEEQILIGLKESDLVLFVVDGKSGLVPLDQEVAKRLRHVKKPKLLVVNKCDSPHTDDEVAEFLRLTDAPVILTSVLGNRNRHLLIDAIIDHLPSLDNAEQTEGKSLSLEPELKLAIVGRRNVGKSTLLNALAETDRMIVSEIPGTTRDSIDIRFEMDRKSFVAIDTPGVRKRKSIANDVEFYGLLRAKRSIRRSNVVLMLFNSQETISRVDKQLIDEIVSNYKPCIFVVNKWDLATNAGMTTEAWSNYLITTFSSLRHAPLAFLTASQGRNTKRLMNLAQNIYKQARLRVATSQLNKVVRAAILNNMPPYRKNKRPKIFYATQVAIEPPTIVLKCNEPSLFDESWKRYLLGVLRENLLFKEVPIKIYMRQRSRDEAHIHSLEDLADVEQIE